jgi:hypothetical protein
VLAGPVLVRTGLVCTGLVCTGTIVPGRTAMTSGRTQARR